METIYSDGKTLEIEKKLKITVFLPQLCYFCKEEITMFGRESDSLCFHSLDEDHDNWDPANKRPVHIGCHMSFHVKGKPRPWQVGDKNVMKDPEVLKKGWKTRRLNDPNNESSKRTWETRRRLYPPTGVRPKEVRQRG